MCEVLGFDVSGFRLQGVIGCQGWLNKGGAWVDTYVVLNPKP